MCPRSVEDCVLPHSRWCLRKKIVCWNFQYACSHFLRMPKRLKEVASAKWFLTHARLVKQCGAAVTAEWAMKAGGYKSLNLIIHSFRFYYILIFSACLHSQPMLLLIFSCYSLFNISKSSLVTFQKPLIFLIIILPIFAISFSLFSDVCPTFSQFLELRSYLAIKLLFFLFCSYISHTIQYLSVLKDTYQ